MWAWGANSSGQLGDTTTTQRVTPVPVTGLSNVRAITVGAAYSLAVKDDGAVWAWGNNSFGQLGNPVAVNHLQPVPVADLASITALAAGRYSSFSLSVPSALLPTVAFAAATTRSPERTGTIALSVVLSAPYPQPVSVDYTVTGGTATGGGVDYMLPSGTLTFAPEQTTATVDLVLIDDTLVEPDETMLIGLSHPSNAVLGSPSAHTFTIIDNDTLTAPVITSPATASGTVGTAFSYQITATQSPTSYGVTGLPAGFSVQTTTGLISGTPAAAGTFSVALRATNAAGTGTQPLTLTIVVGNRAPVATSGAVTTAEDVALPLTLSATDPDGDPLTYTLETLPSHGTLSGAGASRTYTPAFNYNGTDSVTFTVNDGQLDSNLATITLTVTPVNDAPIVTHTASHRFFLNEDDSVPPIDFVLSDVDTPVANLTISATSSNIALIPNANIQLSGSGATRTMQITLAPNQSGIADVTVIVSDGQGGEDGHGITFIVNPINDAPTLAPIPAQTVAEGQPLSLTLTGSDVEGDPLTYRLMPLPPGATLDSTTGVFRWTPAFDQAGSYALTASVSDGTLSASQPLTLTVTPTNQPPTAASQSLTTAEDTLLALTLSGSDPEGDPLTYAIIRPPAHGTLSGTAPTLTYTPAPDYAGADSVTFTVNDGVLTSAPALLALTITPVNDPPTLTSPATCHPSPAFVGAAVTCGALAQDVEGDALRYAWSWGEGSTATGSSVTHAYASAGSYPVTVTVSDGAGGTVSDGTTLTIQPLRPDTTPPWAPTNLHSVGVGATRVVLAWDAASDPTITGEQQSGLAGYHLFRDGQVGGLLTTVTTTETNLHPQTSSTYQVDAVDAAGNRSQRSQPLTLTTAVLGDLDGDAHVTLADLRLLVQMLLGQRAVDLLHADLDGDGRLSLGDARGLVGLLAGQ